jgi:hypothetical protein
VKFFKEIKYVFVKFVSYKFNTPPPFQFSETSIRNTTRSEEIMKMLMESAGY